MMSPGELREIAARKSAQSAEQMPDQGKAPGVDAVAAGSGSVPASELRNLAITWRSHAFTAPADMQLALDSCAMDLDRLAESYDPREPRPNTQIGNPVDEKKT